MRFARSDMRDHIVSRKTTTELRIGATEYCRSGVGYKSASASFSTSFNFRLLQHYLPEADVTAECEIIHRP
jgi:hypothetical protein